MKLRDYFDEVEKLEEKKKLPLTDMVFGSSRKGMAVGDKFFDWLTMEKENADKSIKYNKVFIVNQLKRAGVSDKDIKTIRKITVDAFEKSVKMIQNKHKEVTDEWVSKGDDLFGKYQLFFNVPEKIRIEFNKYARKLIEKELEKKFA